MHQIQQKTMSNETNNLSFLDDVNVQITPELCLQHASSRDDWKKISQCPRLSRKCIKSLVDYLDPFTILNRIDISRNIISIFRPLISWKSVCKTEKLSFGIIRGLGKSYELWHIISKHQKLSEFVMSDNEKIVDWVRATKYQHMTEEFMFKMVSLIDVEAILFAKTKNPQELPNARKTAELIMRSDGFPNGISWRKIMNRARNGHESKPGKFVMGRRFWEVVDALKTLHYSNYDFITLVCPEIANGGPEEIMKIISDKSGNVTFKMMEFFRNSIPLISVLEKYAISSKYLKKYANTFTEFEWKFIGKHPRNEDTFDEFIRDNMYKYNWENLPHPDSKIINEIARDEKIMKPKGFFRSVCNSYDHKESIKKIRFHPLQRLEITEIEALIKHVSQYPKDVRTKKKTCLTKYPFIDEVPRSILKKYDMMFLSRNVICETSSKLYYVFGVKRPEKFIVKNIKNIPYTQWEFFEKNHDPRTTVITDKLFKMIGRKKLRNHVSCVYNKRNFIRIISGNEHEVIASYIHMIPSIVESLELGTMRHNKIFVKCSKNLEPLTRMVLSYYVGWKYAKKFVIEEDDNIRNIGENGKILTKHAQSKYISNDYMLLLLFTKFSREDLIKYAGDIKAVLIGKTVKDSSLAIFRNDSIRFDYELSILYGKSLNIQHTLHGNGARFKDVKFMFKRS